MIPAIEVRNLIKQYKKSSSTAVDNISFSVENGEFFSLLGPNGAGKTTTISILTTTLSKTAGTVRIAGKDLDEKGSAIRQSIGVIFQQPSLDLNLTAEENVRLQATLYNLYSFRPTFSLMPDAYKKRVAELADVLGISDDLFKPLRTFSGGMRRKLEIIRGLMHQPKILFLDEPTTGLDPLSRKNLWEYLRRIREVERTTVFLTTHYLEEAEDADHICILDHGAIIAIGTPEEVKRNLIEEFILMDAKDRKALRSELTHLGLPFVADTPFRVNLAGQTPHQIIRSIRTPLTLLKIHSPTLEEAYLEAIKHEEHGL